MNDDILYNSIEEIEYNEELLKKIYNLNTNSCDDQANIDINNIFYNCYLRAFGYTYAYKISKEFSPFINNLNSFSEMFLNDDLNYKVVNKNGSKVDLRICFKSRILDFDEMLIYDSLKNHCIIKALNSVEYLLTKEQYVDIKPIGKVNSDALNKRFDKLYKNGDPFYNKLCNLKRDDSKRNIERKIPMFLSSFSNSIINNMGNNYFSKEISILEKKSKKGVEFRKKLNDIIEGLEMLNNKVVYLESKTSNFQKVLFEYKKESVFSFQLLKYLFSDLILSDNLLPKNSLDQYDGMEKKTPKVYYEKIYKERKEIIQKLIDSCLKLPNVFSRNFYINIIYKYNKARGTEEDYEEGIAKTINDIEYLCKITFPVFENLFFSVLYNTCLKAYGKDNVIESIRNCTSSYINTNYKNTMCRYSFIPVTDKEYGNKNNSNLHNYFDNKLKDINNSKDRYDYISRFLNTSQYNNENINGKLFNFNNNDNLDKVEDKLNLNTNNNKIKSDFNLEYIELSSKYLHYAIKAIYNVDNLGVRFQQKLLSIPKEYKNDIFYLNQYDISRKILS